MERHWFEDVADHLGSAYLRYSFTKGTDQEVDFLWGALGLEAGSRVLDVGCGPGRHARALAERGAVVTGVDISERFLEIARLQVPDAAFVRADARALAFDGAFDAVVSLCQGAFGLSGGPGTRPLDPDEAVLEGMARALVPGGTLALSAFSAYFQVRHLGDATAPGFDERNAFEVSTGVHHEHMEIRDEDGHAVPAEAWTTCFTPRELRFMAGAAGLEPLSVWGVEPGDYARREPGLEHPEFLLLARRPPSP